MKMLLGTPLRCNRVITAFEEAARLSQPLVCLGTVCHHHRRPVLRICFRREDMLRLSAINPHTNLQILALIPNGDNLVKVSHLPD
jgi:hypothetical protein